MARETLDLNTINQIDLTDIYRTFHQPEAKYTLLKNARIIPQIIEQAIKQVLTNLRKLKSYQISFLTKI